MTIDELRIGALESPCDERELLGVELLCSLDSEDTRTDVEAAWAREIIIRSDAYHAGTIEALDSEGTVERLRQKLAARKEL